MIRVLTSILAVVAAILAVVLKQPLLFVLAGLLVLCTFAMIALRLRRNHRQAQESYLVPKGNPSSDLKSLGILEIRPREGSRPMKTEGDQISERPQATARAAATDNQIKLFSDSDQSDGELPDSSTGEVRSIPDPVLTGDGASNEPGDPSDGEGLADRPEQHNVMVSVREKDPTAYVAVEAAAAWVNDDVIIPFLHALRAALGACSVCLLRQEEFALRYSVEAMVSQNSYARSQGRFSTGSPLLSARMAGQAVSIRRVDEGDLSIRHLGYYCERINVREVAIAPVTCIDDDSTCFLLADSRKEGILDTPHARSLLTQFAKLIASMLGASAKNKHHRTFPPILPIRPRREILAEEMNAAREAGHPLALALVHLPDTADLPENESIDNKTFEAVLHEHLVAFAPKARVERFGELTYGVMFNDPGEVVEAWAEGLLADLHSADALLKGGVVVGVVLMTDRHQTPEEFKDEAVAALYEAYETGGTCIILE